jgi:hypothetical protein
LRKPAAYAPSATFQTVMLAVLLGWLGELGSDQADQSTCKPESGALFRHAYGADQKIRPVESRTVSADRYWVAPLPGA